MPFITFDKERNGAVTGRFTKENIAKQTGKPYIEITTPQLAAYSQDPNNFYVENNKLVAVEQTFTNFTKARSIQENKASTARTIAGVLTVNGYSYKVDNTFQQNLNSNLAIVALDSEHTCKLWCSKNDTWEFKQHSKDALLELAKAFNTRREVKSAELYKNL